MSHSSQLKLTWHFHEFVIGATVNTCDTTEFTHMHAVQLD